MKGNYNKGDKKNWKKTNSIEVCSTCNITPAKVSTNEIKVCKNRLPDNISHQTVLNQCFQLILYMVAAAQLLIDHYVK